MKASGRADTYMKYSKGQQWVLPSGTLPGFLLLLALLCSVFCVWGCSSPTAGATEVGNPGKVVGTVMYTDSRPASGVEVYIRPRNVSLLFGDEGALKKTGSVDIDPIITDSNGNFAFTNLDSGVYYLEAVGEERQAAYLPKIYVQEDTLHLETIILEHTGCISGKVRLHDKISPQGVFVLVYGVNRFCLLKEDGTFEFNNMPSGQFDLEILKINSEYDIFDTTVQVLSGDTVNLEVSYPAINTFLPRLISMGYAPISQAVIIRWTQADPSQIKGLLIYRAELQHPWWEGRYSDFEIIPSTLLTSLSYRDTGVEGGKTYIYKVDAVVDNDMGTSSFFTIGQDTISIPGGDLTPPEIIVHSPQTGLEIDTADVELAFTISDSSGFTDPTVTLDSVFQKVSLSDSSLYMQEGRVIFSSATYTVPLQLKPGGNEIKISSVDLSVNYNIGHVQLQVLYDTTAVELIQ